MMRYDTPLLSIIIPVYNVENYVEKCVESVIPKEIAYEVIIVDDGSTDSSLSICLNLQQKNKNIKVFHKENGGLSSARNHGMRYAKGTYITFPDSDDYLESNAYDRLLLEIKKQVDILKFSYVIENGENIKEIHSCLSDGIYEKKEIEEQILPLAFGGNRMSNSTIQGINLSATSNIYRLRFLQDNSLTFTSEREVGSEDFLFNIQCFLLAERVQVVNACLYHYVQREGSLTRQYRADMYGQYRNLCEILYQYMDRLDILDEFYTNWQGLYCSLMYFCIWNECNKYAPGSVTEKTARIKTILDNPKFQNNIRNMKILSIKDRVLKFLIKIKAAGLIYIIKSK